MINGPQFLTLDSNDDVSKIVLEVQPFYEALLAEAEVTRFTYLAKDHDFFRTFYSRFLSVYVSKRSTCFSSLHRVVISKIFAT